MKQNPDGSLSIQIQVLGIGDGGCKTLNYLVEKRIPGLNTIAIDSDSQALLGVKAHERILIGDNLIRGQGARGNPDLGRMAAEENRDELERLMRGSDLVFITTGLGGGTGSGAAPVLAAIAKQGGAVTIGITTLPFPFEGSTRMKIATLGLQRLEDNVDALVAVPADTLVRQANDRTSIEDSFSVFAEAFTQTVKGISELIIVPGLINLDFADLRTIISGGRSAAMAFGKAPSDDRARIATDHAIDDLLGTLKLEEAGSVLFSVTGGSDLTLFEVTQVASFIREKCNPDVNMIFGAITNPVREDLCVKIFATNDRPNRMTRDDGQALSVIDPGRKEYSSRRSLKVFLCHSSSDKPAVRKLYQKLYSRQGIDPWLDEAKLLPGELWNHEITTAVKESDVVIVCISKGLMNKEGYVQKEVKRALDIADEKPEGTIFIIPLKLEECEVPERLSEWQWVNYHEEGAFERLMQSLRKRADTLGIEIE